METIYFDNAASAIPDPGAVKAYAAAANIYANPSSLHSAGLAARKMIENARSQVASAFRCREEEIFFTSGGTESNNIAVRGCAHKNRHAGNVIVTAKAEHPSVYATANSLAAEGFETVFVSAPGGIPDLGELENVLKTRKVCLVALMQANNQNGAVTDLKKVRECMKNSGTGALLHSDAVQAFLKLPEDQAGYAAAYCDTSSVSAHKIGGVKGCGALYVRKGLVIPPLFTGGEQENSLRCGTENLPGICAMGEAARLFSSEKRRRISELREYLLCALNAELGENVKISVPEPHIDTLVNISLTGVKSEVILNSLSAAGICVSSSSACSSKAKVNTALAALGYGKEYEMSAIRIGISPFNTERELDALVLGLKNALSYRIKGK